MCLSICSLCMYVCLFVYMHKLLIEIYCNIHWCAVHNKDSPCCCSVDYQMHFKSVSLQIEQVVFVKSSRITTVKSNIVFNH